MRFELLHWVASGGTLWWKFVPVDQPIPDIGWNSGPSVCCRYGIINLMLGWDCTTKQFGRLEDALTTHIKLEQERLST